MLTLQIDNELETTFRQLTKQEHMTPEQLIQKLIGQYTSSKEKEDFFSYSGLWEGRDITQESLREQAWRK